MTFMMWMGLIQSDEATEIKLKSAWEEGILLPDGLPPQAAASALPWVTSLPAHPVGFRLANLHNHGSQFSNQPVLIGR